MLYTFTEKVHIRALSNEPKLQLLQNQQAMYEQCMAVSLARSSSFKHKDLSQRTHQKIPTTVLLLQMRQSLQEVKQLHAQFIVTGLLGHPLNPGRLLESYVKISQMDYAISVFESINSPDIFAYNTAIRGLTLCNHPHAALSLYNTLLLEGQIPDNYTYTFVLKACSFLEAVCEGEQVHCQIIKAGISTSTHINSSLIHMYTVANRISCAELVLAGFSEVETTTLNSMISGYLRHGHVKEARELFDRIEGARDVASWNSMISGYTKNGLHVEALELFQEMMASQDLLPIAPDESTLVSSLSAIAHLGTLDQGRWLHTYIKRNGSKIGNNLGAALIDMYAKCGSIESAYEVFEEMPKRDIVTWGAIVSGFAIHGQVQKCFELFHEMIMEEGTHPNEVIFVSILSACAHAGYVDMGYHYFNKMVHDFRIKPSVEHYGCMVDLLGRAGKLAEAEEFIESMPEQPNSVIWGTFLNACRMHNDARRGSRALRHIMDLEPNSGERYKLAGIMFANAGERENAEKVWKFMEDFDLKATSGLSSVEVEGEFHEFLAGDIGHDEVREIYTLWDGLTEY